MDSTILITYTRYVDPDQVARLQDAGYVVRRSPAYAASEDELCALVGDVTGYLHGGAELLTPRVVQAAAHLRAVAFCGSGWTETIVAHDELTARGIPIATTAGSNADSVAEYTLALVVAALRRIPYAEASPALAFFAGKPHEWGSVRCCVIGAGHIGTRVAELLGLVGFRVSVLGRERTSDRPAFERVLRDCDVVVVCVSKRHGAGVLGAHELGCLSDGALVVSPVFAEAIDAEALRAELASGRLSAAVDAPPAFDTSSLPAGALVHSQAGRGYDTAQSLRRTSEWAVASMMNLLADGDDARVVNPGFRAHR